MSDEHDWRGRRSTPGRDASRDLGRHRDGANWRTEDESEPFDMAAVHTDDQFIDSLSRDVPVHTRDDAEYQLAALLSGWRHESLAEPAPELPTVDEVERAIAASERVSTGRKVARHLRLASGAAAVVVIAGAGLTVLAEGSQPGDPLWGVKKVVFAEAASETQAAVDVQSNLERAEALMAAGKSDEAAELIDRAQKNMGPVRDADTRSRMSEWIDRLRAGATTSPSGSSSESSDSSSTSQSVLTPPQQTGPTTPPRDLRQRSQTRDRGPSTTVTIPSQPQTGDDQGPGPGTSIPPEFPTATVPTPTTNTTLPSRPADIDSFPVPTTQLPSVPGAN
ncbi:anti-sigma-D factor RsdA [Gordonia soli]|uniref:Anti-sigma-D factor RsdA sigma factor binding region domain-containing protein n=1 Tax=Gordonia soli NBRC 108243 TaxID=1223545 RepID=M0QMV7_9ACTN|nr:anti-sigma-D factor RsdA [Gordonia soli]GAC69888.1 hypothetical protein GS4_28_01360 [Gordonia soli NBRC 108243]